MPNFPPPAPPAKKPHTNAIIIGSAAAAIAVIVIAGAVAANDGSSSEAAPQPTVTVTETATETVEMTDQEIVDRGLEIVESASADLEAGIEPDITVPAAEEPVEEEPAGPLTSIGEGTYLVGEDVKAGSYKTDGPTGDMCYWARRSDDSGELDAIIANDIVKGPGRVTLKKGEFFETNSCETWELVK